ncbi:MAG TPA: alpha-amylase family glycosyl hydrolase, partial [Terriglobales bacterium]|nr:alpha-amylase family glycosyl hydrolase [Terriglobales bacterium]
MPDTPTFEFHVARQVRDRYGLDDRFFSFSGNVVFANLAASREFAHRMNLARDAERHPERAVHPGALNAMGLIDEALHAVLAQYREQRDPLVITDALAWFEARLGREPLDRTLVTFSEQFPTAAVYRGQLTARDWLARSTGGVPHRAVALEELMMLWLANANRAFRPFRELFDDDKLADTTAYRTLTAALRDYFETRPRFGPDNQNLFDMLRAPALASPDDLAGQLAFIQEKWKGVLGDFIRRMLTALDILKEEEVAIWLRFHPPVHPAGGPPPLGDSSAAAIPTFTARDYEYERFSPDTDWMPRTVLIAKTVYVWLDQLSRIYRRHIHRLDHIPDEELDILARRGFNALWLIGVWERSRASQRIKQMCGNPEAVASAYSLLDYTIAEDLGGEAAYTNLRERARSRGIRLASDMVPNHMGIDSRWVIQHPDWFLSLPHSPYPAYHFEGPDVSSDGRVEIKIEDHYFNRTDAAVVFRRVDRWTGDTRYIYHGNDGTSFPWNDTAQLNYLKPEVREGVIQTILHVARLFPIIRFDAAMTLAKRHYQRLWFPQPGTGGAIPSRAEHGMTKAEFDAAMPLEFWREVVDRVAAEVPDTLLLAEAFWLMEGYFVRTLGMHRVYNSAFMNMLRDEENANYRSVMKNTLEFDPDVLKRYVNFMNNPDERTAVDQFGKGDKYFGVCTMLATLPGTPMFGHGQVEGFTEKYGMEYRRAYHEETPDQWLIARHEREISPLLHRRSLFAEAHEFLLYDFFTDQGFVNEDVFAYSNRRGHERALIVYHNRYATTSGWIRISCAYAEKTPGGARHLRQRTLANALGVAHAPGMFIACRDAITGLEYLHRAPRLAEQGLHVELGAYKCHVFLDWRDVVDDGTRPWSALCDSLAGKGVSSLEDALRALELKPVHDALRELLTPAGARAIAKFAAEPDSAERTAGLAQLAEGAAGMLRALLTEVRHFASGGSGAAVGLGTSGDWRGDVDAAVRSFQSQWQAALRVPQLERLFSAPWPADARAVLPAAAPAASPSRESATPRGEESKDDGHDHQPAIWATVLAWCALEALGKLRAPTDSDRAAAELFDALRFR